MISAVLSNGEFLCIIFNGTGDLKKNYEFAFFCYAIVFTKIVKINLCRLKMNDATIHHSIKAVNVIKILSLIIMYLPAYCHKFSSSKKFL